MNISEHILGELSFNWFNGQLSKEQNSVLVELLGELFDIPVYDRKKLIRWVRDYVKTFSEEKKMSSSGLHAMQIGISSHQCTAFFVIDDQKGYVLKRTYHVTAKRSLFHGSGSLPYYISSAAYVSAEEAADAKIGYLSNTTFDSEFADSEFLSSKYGDAIDQG